MSAHSTDPQQGAAWTIRRLQAWMTDAFVRADLDQGRLLSELLLAHVFGCDRLALYTDPDRPASRDELDRLRDLVRRALRHEPVQYLVGEAWFYGLRFKVDRRALIPRPCSELLVERAVDRLQPPRDAPDGHREEIVVADVCTGSGCLAISIARQLPHARLIATDISPEALSLAAENIASQNLDDRIELREGDLLAPLMCDERLRGSLAAIVANPPYIPDDEWPEVAPNVREHEPTIALRGGPDGLDLVRPIIRHADSLLRPGGVLLIEVAARRADDALAIVEARGKFTDARIHRDQDDLPRVIEARRA